MKRILLLLALLPTLSWADGLPTTPYIYVQGSATMNVMPDTLTLSFSLSCTDPDQAKAKLAVSEQSSAVFKLLKDLAVPDQAVIAQSLQSSAKYDYRGGKNDFLGYVVQRTFTVTFSDFSLFPRILDGLFALHVASVHEVRPSYSKNTEASAKLKSTALVDAKTQADSIATEMGARVVSVFSVSPVPPGSIRGTILGADGYAFTPGLRAQFEMSENSLTVAGDRFSFELIKLTEWIHVIFLIEPVKK